MRNAHSNWTRNRDVVIVDLVRYRVYTGETLPLR
jgi:hypothetical protein